MPKFVYAYHGVPEFESPEAGAQHMTKWRAWTASLGDALIDPGLPLGQSKTVSANGVAEGGGPNPVVGISVVEADSLDAAVEMTKGCPHLDHEHCAIEVAEAMDMEM